MTLLTLKRAGVPLKRDVIFLATADEEVGGGVGAGWFVEQHKDLVQDAEFLLNEGGTIRTRSEEHTSELQSRRDLVCRLLLEKKNRNNYSYALSLTCGYAY